MIASGVPQFAARLAMMMPIENPPWREATVQARAEYEAWQQCPPVYASRTARLNLWQVVRDLEKALPEDFIICNGAGNFATWGHRFHRYSGLRTQLAPTAGSMGYGVPAGVAAKIVAPERTVVVFAGDGDFLMTGQELATAAQYRAGVLVILFNNGMYGTIRMHQERDFPARVHGTELANPRFDLLAQAYGGFGAVVETNEQFVAALAEARDFARNKQLPALVELRCDPDVITPGTTISAMRAAPRK
jgi:acetolactate synthase-1/2/3 large subunit